MKKIHVFFDKLDRSLFFIAQVAVVVMMLTTVGDVLGRMFDRPLIGAYEFTENYLMVIAVFLSLSYVMKMKGHIKVDVLVQRFPAIYVRVLDVLFMLMGAALMLMMGYQGVLMTVDAWVNKYTSSGLIPWPTWLSVVWVPIGAFMFVLRLILEAVKVAFGWESEPTDHELLQD